MYKLYQFSFSGHKTNPLLPLFECVLQPVLLEILTSLKCFIASKVPLFYSVGPMLFFLVQHIQIPDSCLSSEHAHNPLSNSSSHLSLDIITKLIFVKRIYDIPTTSVYQSTVIPILVNRDLK